METITPDKQHQEELYFTRRQLLDHEYKTMPIILAVTIITLGMGARLLFEFASYNQVTTIPLIFVSCAALPFIVYGFIKRGNLRKKVKELNNKTPAFAPNFKNTNVVKELKEINSSYAG